MAKSKKKRQQSSIPKDIPHVTPLPPELLWDIFHLVKSDRAATSPEGLPFEVLFPPELAWVPEITHICRHWRAVALADPSLWAEICVSASNKWATEFLTRSKESRTIRLTCDMAVEAVVSGSADARRKGNFKLCRMLLKKCMDRLEGVRFTSVDIAQVQGLLTVDYEDEVVQGLKEFAVSGASDSSRYDPVLILTDEETLFLFNPTLLCQLEIGDCVLNWDALKRFHKLTHLRLNFVSSRDTNMAPRDLQEALKVMPQLKQLEVVIEGIVRPTLDSQDDQKEVIVLPDLCLVRLYHPEVGWIRQIIQSIASLNDTQAPGRRECTWDIGSADPGDTSWNNGGLLTTLSQHVISAVDTSSLQMHFINKELEYELRQGVVFSIWPFKAQTRSCDRGSPLVRYEALVDRHGELDRGDEGMKSLAAIKMFCDSGSHDNLTEMEIMGETSLPCPDELANTIGQLPRLQKVTLRMNDWRAKLGSFFLALSFDEETCGIPFAALQSIHVKRSLSIDGQAEREILEGLRNRHSRGFPITHLELPLEHPKAGYSRDVDSLKKVVGSLFIGQVFPYMDEDE